MLKKKILKQKTKLDLYIDSKKLLDHLDLHKFLKKCLIYLKENKVEPRISETISVINYWNKNKNQRFTKHRINENSSTFKVILSLISYRMHYHKISLNTFFDGIKKFEIISNSNGLLLYKKKLKLVDNFLWGEDKRSSKSWFEICIEDEDSAIADTCGIKINFKKTFERVKKTYINIFHEDDNEIGKMIIFQNSFLFISFSEMLVEYHKTRTMCDYRNNFDRLIWDYFTFAREVTENSKRDLNQRIFYILGKKLILDFAMRIRNEPGQEKFFSEIRKKSNKTT